MNCAFKVLRSLCEGVFFEYAFGMEYLMEMDFQACWNEVNIKWMEMSPESKQLF